MDNKSKDSVFAVVLILLGCFVLYEGVAMVNRASKPPYNVTEFSISPGMMPVVLGGALVLFSALLLAKTLWGTGRPMSSLAAHLKTSSVRFGKALGEVDTRSMAISVVIMAVYTFFILGDVPFWIGAMLFLVGLMLFLRAGKAWTIVAVSGVSVTLIILLFQNFFKTTLP
jgi:hypothetical protein